MGTGWLIYWSNIQPEFRQMWIELQRDLTKLSTNSRQLFADRSSHFMNFDQPDLIISAIRQMLDDSYKTASLRIR